MALSRINRLKYCHVKWRQEGIEIRPSERKKRYYRNYFIIVLFIIVMHYCYTNFWLSTEIDNPFDEPPPRKLDEYLTTQFPDEENHELGFLKPEDNMRYYMMNATIKTVKKHLPRCIKVKRIGRIYLNTSRIELSKVESKFPKVQNGGYFAPLNCSSKDEVAIIVAYRGRETNLAIFLYNIHPILMEQQIEYQIFIVEQADYDLFNKGRLFNAGFKEAMKYRNFRCLVFHDLDLLPMFYEILYACPTIPRHMSTVIDHSLIKQKEMPSDYQFKSMFGGVVSLTVEMFVRVNGYSNVYFGWGGEDNDMFWRLRASRYPIVKYNKTMGVYIELPHPKPPANKFRHHLLVRAVERYKTDGLSNLEYEVVANNSHHLYTHLLVDINPKKENVTALTIKWATGEN